MAAAKLDLYIEQGAGFYRKLTFKTSATPGVPVDITGWVFKGQIRKTASDPKILSSFSYQTLDQTTDTGSVLITLTPVQTTAIPVTASITPDRKIAVYIYDLYVTKPDGSVERILEGAVDVSPEVTK